MSAATADVGVDAFWQMVHEGRRTELVRGEVRTRPLAAAEDGHVSMSIGTILTLFIESNRLGAVFMATGFILGRNPDTVRAADFAFVAKNRLPKDGIPKKFYPGAPDLAVEVVSPSDTFDEVENKIGEWLAAGTQLVVIVRLAQRIVKLYRSATQTLTLNESDTFTAEELLPGFSCRVSEIFNL